MVRLSRSLVDQPMPGQTGIVHLGIGAFHRAHQAVYTEDAMAATGDDRWGICGAAMRSTSVVDQLRPQDGLYSVLAGDDLRVLGPVREVIGPDEDLLVRLAAPGTRIISLTVTEKAYLRDPIEAELAGARPYTVVGKLVRGLQARAAADAGPVTVVCCDNLPGNGRTLAGLVEDFCARLPHGSPMEWISENVRFPSTMVDRIVPATTREDLAVVAGRLGAEDLGAVVTEPFSQWVIEDSFAAERPAWERAGALLVADVSPYERMKLRLLNGSHSALAYLGALAGKTYVADAIAEPAFAELVQRLMDDDVTPTLHGLDGFDLAAYKKSLQARFANRGLRHRTTQIAADGSQKLPPRLLDPARERLAAGHEPRWLALAVAAWMRYVTAGQADNGTAFAVDDPIRDLLAGSGDADRLLRVFGAEVHPVFRDLCAGFLRQLTMDGAVATVRSALRG